MNTIFLKGNSKLIKSENEAYNHILKRFHNILETLFENLSDQSNDRYLFHQKREAFHVFSKQKQNSQQKNNNHNYEKQLHKTNNFVQDSKKSNQNWGKM